MKSLNLVKYNSNNFEKLEFDYDDIQFLEQDIIRSYEYLIKTHKTNSYEEIVLRTLRTRGSSSEPFSKEYFVSDFEDYRKTVLEIKLNKKATYDIYYHIFNMSKRKMDEFGKEHKDKMKGNSETVSSTSILEADFDGIEYSDYLHIREEFQKRGIETIDKWSGHGVHIIVLLKENCNDEDILKKWILTLQQAGLQPDIMCKDAARLMRLPFFNNTKTKYEKITRAEIIEDTCRRYELEDVFRRFGQDYSEIKINNIEVYKKVEKRIKEKVDKNDIESNLISLESINSYYEMDFNMFSVGIREMLRGLRVGCANLQTYFLSIYFKKYYKDETIKYIIQKLEEINDNEWNTWKASKEVERFLENYDYLTKFDILQMQAKFGEIKFLKNIGKLEDKIVISSDLLNFDSKEIKLYLGFKYRNINSCRSSNLFTLSNLKKSSLYKIVGNLVTKRNNIYYLQDREFLYDDIIVLASEQMERLLYELSSDELKVYLYLRYIKREKTNILTNSLVCVKQEEISDIADLTRQTVSKILKKLRDKKLILIHKGYYIEEEEKQVADSYLVY
ncbi:helix-turn-helix domain-containing protein [uncultured Clostridium sp.]|uniref:helix-turn-helix domain-containing protein n=1 Tax=uncultured Clostridium sp. TaxID=59620 RepID=UPI0026394784|nr:helix-turn-helix domain-containing protein [uncultured Clostridium sp.]